MMTYLLKYKFLFLFVLLSIQQSNAQLQKDICEYQVPSNWKAVNGTLKITGQHYKLGKQSFQWKWNKSNAYLQIDDNVLKDVINDPRSTFVFWAYNATPLKDKLHFVFLNGEEEVYKADFALDFNGWRTAWMMYHRDMQKLKEQGINRLRIYAPKSVTKGELFLDQVMLNVNINPRSPMRDQQVPYVNLGGDKAANAHWTSLYKFSQNKGYLLQKESNAAVFNDIDSVQNKHLKLIANPKVNTQNLQQIRTEYDFWNISYNKGVVTGRPIFSVNDIELVDIKLLDSVKKENEKSNIKRYSILMLQVAQAWNNISDKLVKAELEQKFMNLLNHLDDQGWSYGSGMGALHHLGYNMGDFYSACLIMKPVIKKQGQLNRTFNTMNWFSGLGRTLEQPDQFPVSNIDVFNTLLGGMLSSVLILDNGPQKQWYLEHYSKWIGKNIEPNLEITGAFKPDGAVFHHGHLYPAYGVGGYNGLAPIIYVLGRTSFKVEEKAHQSFKENMLMMHYYTNPTRWPLGVAGRHPTGNWRIPDMPFAYMALAGTPDGKQPVDKEMAAVYLLITKNANTALAKQFSKQGILPAKHPEGHWNLNFGLLDIHRRADWLLTVKAHNRYFVSHESYPRANMFGRYLSYGQVEIAFPESQKNASGFKDLGWDWNRIPGTTTLHVPLNVLRADIKNVDDFSGVEEMLLTDEVFAGGTNLDKQGVFAMKLHGHDKYNMGSFRVNKSWFTFDNLLIALGSDINNNIDSYPTETTLFQNNLKDKNEVFQVNGEKNITFPFVLKENLKQDLVVTDNRGITYYVPRNQQVNLYKKTQQSRDQKDLQDTKGNFAGLVLDHGRAPQQKSYEYAIAIKANDGQIEALKNRDKAKPGIYQVLQQDSLVHSVYYAKEKMTGLAIFTSKKHLTDKIIRENSIPCLVLYKENGNQLELSVTDPDLRFYQGKDDTPLNADGTRKEVSIYSRYWFKTPAQPSVVELKINGTWEKTNNSEVYSLTTDKEGNTIVQINCKYGLPSKINIKKR